MYRDMRVKAETTSYLRKQVSRVLLMGINVTVAGFPLTRE